MKVIYEDENVRVLDKPAGVNADEIPRRIHRLDKDTSGVLLVAKNDKALEFFQKQFQERKIDKKYKALVMGHLKSGGAIKTLLGRSPGDKRKQRAYLTAEPRGTKNLREAKTEYRVLKHFKDYTLIEAKPITGRKHQIRAHMTHIHHPIAGDKLYSFKNAKAPKDLKRQFLHASSIKITMPDGTMQEFASPLPKDLKNVISQLESS